MPIKKMMSSNYRNQCGICGGLGHNSRSCPQLETIAKQAIDKQENNYSLTYQEQRALASYRNKKNAKPIPHFRTKRGREQHKFVMTGNNNVLWNRQVQQQQQAEGRWQRK